MSYSYDLICLECDGEPEYDFERTDPKAIYQIVKTAPLLRQLDETEMLDVTTIETYAGLRPGGFLLGHLNHRFVVQDEYGRIHHEDRTVTLNGVLVEE